MCAHIKNCAVKTGQKSKKIGINSSEKAEKTVKKDKIHLGMRLAIYKDINIKQKLYGVRKEKGIMKKAVIVSACRTAIGSFGGTLKDVPAAELGALVVKEAVSRAGIKPEQVDEVIFGNVLQAGLGQNVARQVTLKAGLPIETTAVTINIVCGSGLKSVAMAANQILAGESEIVVCGGTENMSAAPYAIPTARWGARMNNTKLIDVMVNDGLWDAFNQYHMGITAENVAEKYGITREMQDEFAVASQSKAEAAVKGGKFKDEIVPVVIHGKRVIQSLIQMNIRNSAQQLKKLPN